MARRSTCLIAGRTGSGKSTLMHALITNLALNYSPDEIDLYLIDFKKGVEFKVYASYELPHASVVAIESEREFGISVLERLDAELRLRADRFREAGVQDVSGYRNVPGTPPLPRILLIVDEFQEFFAEEDKLAQEAASVARPPGSPGSGVRRPRHPGLAEPGRGLHAGPQHAGPDGRSDRASVQRKRRPSDPGENNIAPRMLSRPGEAIYNDANGAPEGNHFFQVVWLSDERREAYLKAAARTGPRIGSRSWRARRSSSRGMPRPTWRATRCLRASGSTADLARITALGPGLGRRRDLDQRSDLGPVPPPGRKPPA